MNRFINYYKKIFSQEYMDRTISGGIKSQLTLLLVTIATVLTIFFIIAMLFSIQLYNRQIKKFPTEKQNVSLKHILT